MSISHALVFAVQRHLMLWYIHIYIRPSGTLLSGGSEEALDWFYQSKEACYPVYSGALLKVLPIAILL